MRHVRRLLSGERRAIESVVPPHGTDIDRVLEDRVFAVAERTDPIRTR
jgi:hypothetical protein